MHSETAIESTTEGRGRRRKRGNGSVEGPVFVDNSGRRSRVLRRIGTATGVVCAGYAVVLVMAFMGWGTSLTPSSLLPFAGGRSGQAPGGYEPQGGIGRQAGLPSGAPSAPPTPRTMPTATATATPTAIATSSVSAN
ncbi:hypothetical protein ABZ915_35995 [Streptomyces sp. NPDC046915]|uniref:hypothetical protein n=1 Tax=Streptomyces sp. NPDC046915 TaxID=3155257 RepID=UPI0033FA7DCD